MYTKTFIKGLIFFLVLFIFLPAIIIGIYDCLNGYDIVKYLIIKIIISLLSALILYIILYKFWRKINISMLSFTWFYIVFIQYCLFCYTFYLSFTEKLLTPIYLENLSAFSQYRYLLPLIGCFIISFFLIIAYFFSSINMIKERFVFPYTKEEIRIFFYTWNESFIGDICVWIIDKLHYSIKFRYLFFSIHFLLFYISRLVFVSLFVNFCFFSGDLRDILYLSFLSFTVWLCNFLLYYLMWFIKANLTLNNEILSTSFADKNVAEAHTNAQGYITITDTNQVIFSLTSEASKYNFSSEHIPALANSWYILNNVLGLFQRYNAKTIYITYIIMLVYFFCWAFITKTFFFRKGESFFITFSGIVNIFSKIAFYPPRTFVARDARYLNEWAQNAVRQKIDRRFLPGHPVYGEFQPDGSYSMEGSMTKGKGPKNSPSIPTLSQPIDPNAPDQSQPQSRIPTKEPILLSIFTILKL